MDARICLCRFVDKVCGPDVGVAWLANGSHYPLRAPRRDRSGFGDAVVFELIPALAVLPCHPPTAWSRVEEFVTDVLAQLGNAEIVQSQAEIAAGQAIAGAIKTVFARHQDDAAGVALDMIGVSLSIVLFASGIGTLGFIVMGASVVLLGTDATAHGLEMSGNEKAERFKKITEGLRLAATVAMLPDLAWGGVKTVREFQEVVELRQQSRAIVTTAQSLGVRARNASRAAMYADIAEPAKLRTQIRTEQIKAAIMHEFSPRAAAILSLGLLIREEAQGDETILREFRQRLRVHVIAVHQQ